VEVQEQFFSDEVKQLEVLRKKKKLHTTSKARWAFQSM
jgi:hypothetical protein